ncbi:hypothetical protein GDO86_007482 [Hymenochirus boettgeri]|uniref:Uncharacterized protein n=1 Tax=Hymenochirus boettgeri TaxID=247094 RepID=A0A8T2ITX1_9PIPI|nr:hypothetical protein GDO86_007482 [Hymenochirus boettgeri]
MQDVQREMGRWRKDPSELRRVEILRTRLWEEELKARARKGIPVSPHKEISQVIDMNWGREQKFYYSYSQIANKHT